MPSNQETIGSCPACGEGELTCRYNRFDRDDLRIDSWEHRCPNCGHRETTAFRSDDPDHPASGVDPRVCPYCGRQGDRPA